MSGLLHLSDTHFGTEQPAVVAALERLVQQCRPDLAVLSGDVTQRATAAQFSAARAFVDRLGIATWVTVPGNHDIPLFALAARLFTPYGRYRATFGEDLEPSADTAEWLVLSHNTTRRYRHAHGEISRPQIERTARRLEAARQRRPDQIRVVVVHQPLAVVKADDRKDLLRGAARAAERWAAAGADIVLGGHIHLPFVLPLHRRTAVAQALWVVQAGTAVSSRVRDGAPNSVNLLRADRGTAGRACIVERWDYDAAADAFVLGGEERLALADNPSAEASHDAGR